MKQKKTLWLWVLCMVCGTMTIQAQEQKEGDVPPPPMHAMERPDRGEIPSPEKEARKQTNLMKKELGLTDKQYDKIYKLNLKEQKKIFERRFGNAQGQRPPMGEGMGFGMPGGGPGGMPDMGNFRPPMGGGRPMMGGGPGGGMRPGGAPRMDKDNAEDLKKEAEKKEKKIKKILTEEQYAKWQTMRKPQEPKHEREESDRD